MFALQKSSHGHHELMSLESVQGLAWNQAQPPAQRPVSLHGFPEPPRGTPDFERPHDSIKRSKSLRRNTLLSLIPVAVASFPTIQVVLLAAVLLVGRMGLQYVAITSKLTICHGSSLVLTETDTASFCSTGNCARTAEPGF